jgi:hypothetical protein
VKVKLPDYKQRMLQIIENYQKLPKDQRLIYRIGRRGGLYSSTDDLLGDQTNYEKIKKLASELSEKGPDETERFITEIGNQYI